MIDSIEEQLALRSTSAANRSAIALERQAVAAERAAAAAERAAGSVAQLASFIAQMEARQQDILQAMAERDAAAERRVVEVIATIADRPTPPVTIAAGAVQVSPQITIPEPRLVRRRVTARDAAGRTTEVTEEPI